jgi:hypothetical protein
MTKAKIKSEEIKIKLNFMVQGLNFEAIIVIFTLKRKIHDTDIKSLLINL